jgi:hypothetical protein
MGLMDVHFAFVSGALHSKCQRGEYEENESCFHCELLWNFWFFFGIASLLLLALPFIHLQALVRAYGTGQSLRGLRPRSQGVAEKVLTNIPFLVIDFLFRPPFCFILWIASDYYSRGME